MTGPHLEERTLGSTSTRGASARAREHMVVQMELPDAREEEQVNFPRLNVQIRHLKIGPRLREDLGDVAELALSIKTHGLLHPIIVDDGNRLVAGLRRVEAYKLLGRKTIEARRLSDLSDAERREIELEENVRRKDLTEYERSKVTRELADTAKEVEADGVLPTVGKKGRGRPPKNGVPLEAVARRTGIPRQTIQRAEAHVEAAEKFPFMQAPDWTQRAVFEAEKHIETLDGAERERALGFLSREKPPARQAVAILRSLARAELAQRAQFFRLAGSGDAARRALALSCLRKSAPEPDPRASALRAAAVAVRRQAEWKDDAWRPRLEQAAADLEALADVIEKDRATETVS